MIECEEAQTNFNIQESSDDDELTDDEEFEKRHKAYEDQEVKRYNIGMVGNKNAQTQQKLNEAAKILLPASLELTPGQEEIFQVISEAVESILPKKSVLSKRKKRESTPSDSNKEITQKTKTKRIKISKSEGNSEMC